MSNCAARYFIYPAGRLFKAVFLLLSLLLPNNSSSVEYQGGDLAPRGNPDGVLNVADLMMLQRLVLEQITPTADELLIGDVAPDNELNAGDLVVLSRAIINSTPLPVVTIGPDELSGSLTQDTTLAADTTYLITDHVTIPTGITLTIEAGARIEYAGDYDFVVEGSLRVFGEVDNKVIFTPTANLLPDGRTGEIKVNNVSTAEVYVNHAIFENSEGFYVRGVPMTLLNSELNNAKRGVEVSVSNNDDPTSGTIISGNTITLQAGSQNSQDNSAIFLGGAVAATISDNTLSGGYAGIQTSGTAETTPDITNNTSSGNLYGVYVGYDDELDNLRPIITGNTIINNTYGIFVENFSNRTYPTPVITANNIYDNTLYNYYAIDFDWAEDALGDPVFVVLDATNNWWGSTNPQEIANSIYDYVDDEDSPTVNYSGFLDGINGSVVPGEQLLGPMPPGKILTAGTTYTVLGLLLVLEGETLTIEEGVQLNFTDEAKLLVAGTLLVNGQPGNEVVFTSLNTSPLAGIWYGIEITDTGNGSVIDHAKIWWAEDAIIVDSDDIVVSNSDIRDYGFYGIDLNNLSSALIDGNTIDGGTTGNYGISMYGAGSITITGNQILNNTRGLRIGSNAIPQVTGNTITNNTNGVYTAGINYSSGISNPAPVVTGNNIYDNTYNYYAALYGSNADNYDLNATGNWWGTSVPAEIAAKIYEYANFYTSPHVIISGYLDGPDGNQAPLGPVISGFIPDNATLMADTTYTIEGDVTISQGATATIDPGAILLFEAGAELIVNGTLNILGTDVNPVLLNSVNVTDPAADAWVGLTINPGSTGGTIDYAVIKDAAVGLEIHTSDFTVSNSLFQHNYLGVRVQNNAAPQITDNVYLDNDFAIYLLGGVAPVITGNAIHTNDFGIALDGTSEAGGNPAPVINNNSIYDNTTSHLRTRFYFSAQGLIIDAANNWWGETDPGLFVPKITDAADDPINLPLVEFLPFLDGPAGAAVPGTFIHGPLSDETITLATDSDYLVADHLYVPASKTLTVGQGTRLSFYSNLGLTVDGSLQVQGATANPARFTSALPLPDKAFWQGITFNASSSANVIDQAEIKYAARGLLFKGAGGAVSNSLLQVNTTGIYTENDATATTIQSSTLTNNSYGIQVHLGSSPTINARNTITNNDYGIFAFGNKQTGNNPNPVINENNIHDNSAWDVVANEYFYPSVITLNATTNWWGTTDPAAIAQNIFDSNDEPTFSPTINITPIQAGPITDTFPLIPTLDLTGQDYTNNAAYTLTGQAEPGRTVQLYQNAVLQGSAVADGAGAFSLPVTLQTGSNALYVTAINGADESLPTDTLTVTFDTTPPVITLTTPAEAALVNYAVFAGQLDAPGTLSVNGGTHETTGSGNSFAISVAGLPQGANSATVNATDLAGNPASLVVNFTLDSQPPVIPDTAQITVGSLTAGQVEITAPTSSATTGDNVILTNTRTGETVQTTVSGDGSYGTFVDAQSGDQIVILINDPAGNATASRLLQVAGSAPALSVIITTPTDTASIGDDHVGVSGTFTGPANVGIQVNGVTAQTMGNTFCAGDISLANGSNTLTATASVSIGSPVSDAISVTRTGTSLVELDVDSEVGFAAHTATFGVTDNSGATIVQVDYDFGDGSAVYTAADTSESPVHSYTTAGCYTATVTLVDDAAVSYTSSVMVVVQDVTEINGQVASVIHGMLNKLRNGNTAGAVEAFMPRYADRYNTLFTNFGADLPDFIDQIGLLTGGMFGDGFARYVFVRNVDGAPKVFFVHLIQNEDGVWKIEDM